MTSDSTEKPVAPGRYIILSSPSGGGKSTIIRRILSLHPDFAYSISATTRPPRPGEIYGAAYCFLSRAEFETRLERSEFLEWEEVYGDYYGTPRKYAEEAVAAGRSVLFDLDVKGALKLKSAIPHIVLIFIMPPSLQVLEARLRQRASEDEAHLKKRLDLAVWECSQAHKFDHVIVNNNLEEAVKAVEDIILQKLSEVNHK
ncbi:MAG: guanylate kinase [bacterium]|nr:guanylate kinase [bacterium]